VHIFDHSRNNGWWSRCRVVGLRAVRSGANLTMYNTFRVFNRTARRNSLVMWPTIKHRLSIVALTPHHTVAVSTAQFRFFRKNICVCAMRYDSSEHRHCQFTPSYMADGSKLNNCVCACDAL